MTETTAIPDVLYGNLVSILDDPYGTQVVVCNTEHRHLVLHHLRGAQRAAGAPVGAILMLTYRVDGQSGMWYAELLHKPAFPEPEIRVTLDEARAFVRLMRKRNRKKRGTVGTIET